MGVSSTGSTRLAASRTNDRCYKAVAAPSDIRHIGFGVLAAAQHAPQLSDVESQAATLRRAGRSCGVGAKACRSRG